MNSGSVNYKVAAILALALGALVYISPLLLPADFPLPSFLQRDPIHLGLDLRGGTHLLFTVDVDAAVLNSVARTGEDLQRQLKEEKIDATLVPDGVDLMLRAATPEAFEKARDLLPARLPTFDVRSKGADALLLTPSRAEVDQLKRLAIDQSLETIRNRIDQFGVSEPSIQRQGETEVVVQLPGVQDPQRAKDLIGRTAVLEFRLVAEGAGADDAQTVAAAAPLPGAPREYKLEKKVLMTGGAVADARVRPGTQMEGPYVELTLNDGGAQDFDRVTGDSVGRNLAIVLDGKVFSAPNIRERISGGKASITGNFDIKEARDLAIVLRAGALPAPIHIVEERTVGPSLGRDSIRQGMLSLAVGGLLVVVFMAWYYRAAGLVADAALVLNVIFLVALLGLIGATLTLPGIAGIVLTLGMAVDANVLINERVREELRAGRSPRAALEVGYDRAWAAIRDSNITTFVSGLILFQFGSGPVKGFAVTLCVGILTTVFTAVFATRTWYELRLSRGGLRTVSV